ncbi:MAG: hypothetical protein JNJ99_06105 [Crocinitomicaceae bacterium]|nr:hypothetical protein [Crocinitomicaceae bacterium]
MAAATQILEKNFDWFQLHKNEITKTYPKGGHVLIWECKVQGVWATRAEALAAGLKIFGNVPFLVRSLKEEDSYQVNFSINPAF